MTWLKPADWSRGDLQCQTSSRRGFSVMCPEISRVQIPSVACNDLLQIKKPWGFWQTWSPSVERWTRHPHASTILWPTSASILSICGAKRASSVSASWVQYEDLEMFQSVRTCMAVHGAVLPGMGPAAADSQRGEHAEVSFWRTFSTFMTGAATTVSKRTHVEKPRSLKGCAAVLLATPIWLCRRWRPFRKPCVSWRKGNSSFCRHGLAHRLQLWLLRAPKIQWAIIFDSRQNGKTNHVWNMQIQQQGAVRTFIGAWQVKTNIDKLTAANMPGEDAQPPRKLLGPLQQSFFSPGEIAGPRWGNRAYGVCSWFVAYVPASRYSTSCTAPDQNCRNVYQCIRLQVAKLKRYS